MTATTTQAALKSALFNAIRSSDAISWEVTYGDPLEGSPNREAVYIGATSSEGVSAEPASFRRGSRNEEYELTVHCDTSNGTDPQETEAAAVAVASEIELLVIENPTLGADGVLWINPAGVELQTGPTAEGSFRTIAKVRLAVKGHLTWP
jgi:hypothetical protein